MNFKEYNHFCYVFLYFIFAQHFYVLAGLVMPVLGQNIGSQKDGVYADSTLSRHTGRKRNGSAIIR